MPRIRTLIVALWMLVPVVLLAVHYGPGQRSLARDEAAQHLARARAAESAQNWSAAVASYAAALATLPAEDLRARQAIQLARANARIYTGELPEAIQDLDTLLDAMVKGQAEASRVREVRASLASAQYYAAWLMRLEGAAREEWTIEADQARQHFRLLAEETAAADPATAAAHRKNLESTIRLARMDLAELQALPLPKQCEGCKNCSQKCRGQRESRNPEPKPQEKQKDARGASVGKRPDGTGS